MSEDNTKKGRSLYYQRFSSSQVPSGGPAYASPAYATPVYGEMGGGAYGASYGEDEPIGGSAMSVGRIIRVCANHWMTIFVFLILGLLASFVIFQLLPTKWEAKAYYAMSVQGRSLVPGQVYAESAGYGGNVSPLQEVFNTRREQFNTPAVQKRVIDLYRTEHSSSAVTTDELIRILREDTEMELVPRSRLVEVSVTAGDPELAANLANAYVSTCESFMGDQNKADAEQAVAWLTTMLDNEEHILAQLDDELLDLRKSRKVESLNRERENIQSRLSALDARSIELASQVSVAKELQAALAVIKEDPTKFGTLPESIPRSSEIAEAFKRYAFEEAEHASKFAELIGEVVWDTKTNLYKRMNAESGACEDKMRLARMAKEQNLDAVHDTVHEMAKDEARHGAGFQGLYKRYFGK